ncbi:MAG: NUDIX hydrolase [Patescibacteria group bacterium]
MENYFRGTKQHPYHLSVGAVIVNGENKICCHYFEKVTSRNKFRHFTDFYILMRETMEMGESIEDTLHRGLKEEFGMTGDIVTYIGSIKGNYPIEDISIEKTTLYFLVKMKTFEPELRATEDAEKESEIQWQTIDFLIPKMKAQVARLNSTMDESSILERVQNILQNNL